MKKGILGMAACVFVWCPAKAADVVNEQYPEQSPYQYSSSTKPSWYGLYLGGHGGWLNGDVDAGELVSDAKNGDAVIKSDNSAFETGNLQSLFESQDYHFGEKSLSDQFIGGFHIGFNWQADYSRLVYGVEGDVSFARDVDFLASLRARLGIDTGRTLFYLTGGLAFARFDAVGFDVLARSDNGDPSEIKALGTSDTIRAGSSGGDTQTGFVVGGGAEIRIKPQWSLGLEGLYYRFDDVDSSVVFRAPLDVGTAISRGEAVNRFRRRDDVDLWTVRARLTYHLDEEIRSLK